jgi:hypothetical protein
MDEINSGLPDASPVETAEPLLFTRREYVDEVDVNAATTSCLKTRNPDDYGPDD